MPPATLESRASVSREVVTELWRLLLPQSAAQVSHEAEIAQFRQVFSNELSVEECRHFNGHLPNNAQADAKFRAITATMDKFQRSGRPFRLFPYDDHASWPHFLDGYLIYYASRYLLAVQFLLADLLRCHRLPSHIRALDVGVGPATTAIALYEFLRQLDRACRSVGEPFPIHDVQIAALDRSSNVLRYANQLLTHYSDEIENVTEAPLEPKFRSWLQSCQTPIHHDLRRWPAPALPFAPNLIIFSNVISDVILLAGDKPEKDRAIVELMRGIQPGGVIAILEHPIFHASLESWLMKRGLLNEFHVVPTTPALSRIGGLLHRSQSFRPHTLFAALLLRTPSLTTHAWRFADPVNSGICWVQAVLEAPV